MPNGSIPATLSATLSAALRRVLPRTTVESIAQWRRRVRASSHAGDAVQCPLCDGRFDGFLPAGERHAIFERYDIVAGGYRDNVRCPRCGCRDRERLVHLFLNLAGQRRLSGAESRVLHIAPERRLEGFLRSSACDYTSADLDGRNVDRQLDVTDMPDADDSFDLVICNHVFEHVPSDGAALDEIARVLAPDGVAIVQVPHATDLAHTHEDDTITDVEARIAAFGQFDHARLYGRDYVERLSSRALAFTPWLPDEDACERHGIDRRDPLMVGRRRDGID